MTNATVEIFISPTCSDCKAGKKFLSEHNIDYTEHDVSQQFEADAQARRKIHLVSDFR